MTGSRRSGAWAIASTEARPFRSQLFWHLTKTLVALILCGVPLVLLTAPPPVDFVELCLRRDAYREALSQQQIQPSPCQIVRSADGQMLAPARGDFSALKLNQIGLIQTLPRVYGLRIPSQRGEVWVQAPLPRGFYQMSGSLAARFRVLLGFLLFYLLLLVFSSLWVSRLNARLEELRQLARRLAAGDLQASLSFQAGDSTEFDLLRRRLLAMAETLDRKRRQEQEQRRHLQLAAEDCNRRLAEVSHDLRTPLTSIIGYAQLCRDEGLPPLLIVETQGQALLERVRQWLEACRLEAAVLDVRPVTCDLHDLLEEAVHLAQQRRSFQVEVQLPNKSPILRADTFLFPRVLSHLMLALACSQVCLKVESGQLELTSPELDTGIRDEALLSLESCTQLLDLQAMRLQPLARGYRLSWEALCKA